MNERIYLCSGLLLSGLVDLLALVGDLVLLRSVIVNLMSVLEIQVVNFCCFLCFRSVKFFHGPNQKS